MHSTPYVHAWTDVCTVLHTYMLGCGLGHGLGPALGLGLGDLLTFVC